MPDTAKGGPAPASNAEIVEGLRRTFAALTAELRPETEPALVFRYPDTDEPVQGSGE